MKKIALFLCCILNFIALAQHIEWAKKVEAYFTKTHFFNDKYYLTGFSSYDTIRIDTVLYHVSMAERKFMTAIEKNGKVDTFFQTANFVPIDFTVENDGYFISGWGPFSFCLAKAELNGDLAWSECYGSKPPNIQHSPYYPSNEAVSIVKHKNSLYVVGHYEDSLKLGNQWLHGGRSLITKVNPSTGNFIWVKTIPAVTKIIDLKDDTFLIGHDLYGVGLFDSITIQPNNNGIVISRSDTNGKFISAKLIVDRASLTDFVLDGNRNMFITGSFRDSCRIGTKGYVGKKGGFFLLKSDNAGNILWSKLFFPSNYSYGGSGPISLCIAPDNSVVLSGTFYSDTLDLADTVLIKAGNLYNTFITKYSSEGNFYYAMSMHSSFNCQSGEVICDNEGSVYWTGWFMGTMSVGNYTFQNNSADYTTYIIKIGQNTVSSVNSIYSNSEISIYPNPSTGIFTVNFPKSKNAQVTVYDVLGNRVLVNDGGNSTEQLVDLSNQPKGIYFLEIVSDDQRTVRKIVVE